MLDAQRDELAAITTALDVRTRIAAEPVSPIEALAVRALVAQADITAELHDRVAELGALFEDGRANCNIKAE